MNKEQFCAILECALLSFEGCDLNMLYECGFNPTIAGAGIKLCEYLKQLNFEAEIWK